MNIHSKSISPPNLVAFVLDNIRLENVNNQVINAIMEIGAYEDKLHDKLVWRINFANDTELAKKLHKLNKLGFLFAGDSAGWPPAEVFDHIRKKGLLRGKFKEVRWKGPGNWFIIER